MLSGTVLWCSSCGTFADKKAKGLKGSCDGRPPRHQHRGGMEGQLRKLRNGTHPKTGAALPPAIEFDPPIGPARMVTVDSEPQPPPEGFIRYEPAVPLTCTAITYAGGLSCQDLHAARLDRIRAKEAANRRQSMSQAGGRPQEPRAHAMHAESAASPLATPSSHPGGRSQEPGERCTSDEGGSSWTNCNLGGSSGSSHDVLQASPSTLPGGRSREADTRSQLDTGGGVWNFLFPNERQLGTKGGGGEVDVLPPPLTRLGGGFQEPGKMLGGVTVVPHSPPTTVFGGGSQVCGEGGNGVDNDDGHAFDNEGGNGDLAQGRNIPPLLRTARPRITIGNSEVPPSTGEAPSEGIKSNQAEEAGTASRDNGNINEGNHRANKVVSSFGAEDDNDGNHRVNKVAPSFVAGSGVANEKGSEAGETSCDLSVAVMGGETDDASGSTDAGSSNLHEQDSSAEVRAIGSSVRLKHAKVSCKSTRKYRINVKGPATCGAGCCRGT